MKKFFLLLSAIFSFVVLFTLTITAQTAVVLVGSGSSVPAPLYSKWSDAFNQRKPSVQMRYLPIGTSEGLGNVLKGTGDFAAGEVPLAAKDKATLSEIPAIVIGIVPIYNVPGAPHDLHFSGELLAEIFLGRVKNWNAPQIAKLNPGATLPDLPIQVVYRPGGKGSNYVFTEFLSKSSEAFRSQVGVSASPTWLVGKPAERSSDMADRVKNQAGAIGYVEAQYAIKDGLPMGAVLNSGGHFVKASPETIANACRSVESPSWDKFGASLINAPGSDSFPISSFTWLYVHNAVKDPGRGTALADLLSWAYSDGQRLAAQEGYTELPPQLLEKVKAKIATLH